MGVCPAALRLEAEESEEKSESERTECPICMEDDLSADEFTRLRICGCKVHIQCLIEGW